MSLSRRPYDLLAVVRPTRQRHVNIAGSAQTKKDVQLFLFARNLLYLHVFVASAAQPPASHRADATKTCKRCTAFFVCAEPAIFTCLCRVGPMTCWRFWGR